MRFRAVILDGVFTVNHDGVHFDEATHLCADDARGITACAGVLEVGGPSFATARSPGQRPL
jgi:hypothetical protein